MGLSDMIFVVVAAVFASITTYALSALGSVSIIAGVGMGAFGGIFSSVVLGFFLALCFPLTMNPAKKTGTGTI